MLQQTQAARVVPAFEAFMDGFPTLADLAAASRAEVLRAWGRLGYPRRAVALHRAAGVIAREHGGRVPRALDDLRALPGVGEYTAAAVASLAFGQPVAAVDTNAVADAAADTVTVPVAPAALAAVADALPTPSADTTSDTTGDGPGDGDAKDDGQGAMPVTVATTVDDGVTTLPLPAAADATPTPSAPAAAAAAAATAATSTSEPSAKRGDDDRKTDAAAAVDASASTTGTTDASGTQASVTIAAGDRTEAADAAQVTARVDHERFERLADGLAARLRVSLAGDGARVRMHLTPRELGEVVVRLELKDGLATAHLIADNRDAGRLLTAAMADLRTALADRGLRLDSVQVRVAGDGEGPMHGNAHAQHQQHDHQARERRSAAPFTFGRLDALRAVETPLAAGEPERGVSVLA